MGRLWELSVSTSKTEQPLLFGPVERETFANQFLGREIDGLAAVEDCCLELRRKKGHRQSCADIGFRVTLAMGQIGKTTTGTNVFEPDMSAGEKPPQGRVGFGASRPGDNADLDAVAAQGEGRSKRQSLW